MTRKRPAQLPEYAVSDEAAAYIADALMEIALQFEATHFAQIRRHYNPPRPHVTTTILGNSTCSAHIRPSERCVHSLVRPAPRAFFRPDRQISQPPRAGPVKAGRVFRGHPKGPGLDWSEHGGILDRIGAAGDAILYGNSNR
jgi:hypothetical protein